MKNISVLASGNGTNLQAILDAIESGRIRGARLVLVISDNKEAFALERAKKHGIPLYILIRKITPPGKTLTGKRWPPAGGRDGPGCFGRFYAGCYSVFCPFLSPADNEYSPGLAAVLSGSTCSGGCPGIRRKSSGLYSPFC